MRQEYLQAIEANQKTNEQMQLLSASNLHRDKKNTFLNSKMHQTCTGTKKNKSFELQSAQNLHRDKKKPKKTKTLEG